MQTENKSLKATVVAQDTELQELKRLAAQQAEGAAGMPSAASGSPALDPWMMQQLFQQYCQMMQQVVLADPPRPS